MFCTKCGRKVRENANFCKECGAKINLPQTTQTISDSSVVEQTRNISDKLINLIKMAEQGDSEAQYYLGEYYLNDEENDENLKLGIYWLEKASEQNHADAQCGLALFYAVGEGVEKKPELSFEVWKNLALQGHLDSQYYFGLCYINGIGVEEDLDVAIYWLGLAAKRGHEEAKEKLGELQDINTKRQSTDTIDAEEQFEIGLEYYDKKNYIQAVYCFKIAAEQGYIEAQYMMGYCYYSNDKGVEHDPKQAIYWFTKAANQGKVTAQYLLGTLYLTGENGIKDNQQAEYWLIKAAEQGESVAQYTLGVYYLNTFGGIIKDDVKAFYWLNKSAEQSNADAQKCLKTLHELSLKNQSKIEAVEKKNGTSKINNSNTRKTGDIVVGGNDVTEQGEWIYHSINGSLSKINKYSDTKVLINNDSCNNLAISGDWLYYQYNNDLDCELYKIRTDGTGKQKLNNSDESYECINVVGDWIYYINDISNGNICKIRTNGSGRKKVCDDEADYIKVIGEWIYYRNSEHDYICRVRTDGNKRQEVGNGNCDDMIISGDWIYYVDGSDENEFYNGCLCKFRISGNDYKKFPNVKCAYFKAIAGDWIYYTVRTNKNDALGSLYKVHTDGSKKTMIRNIEVSEVNIIGNLIFYRDTHDSAKLWVMQTDGTNNKLWTK